MVSIGLFDSGFGGLTVLRELHRVIPEGSYLYLADNARFPYGTKGKETIVRYARECARFLCAQGIDILVIACNTATAMALPHLQAELPIPVIGTVAPAVRVALATTKGVVGVLGTSATVAAGVYEQALHELRPSVRVISQPCPLFVPLVEAGMVEGEIVEKVVELYLKRLRERDVDTVILGCTHYPLLRRVIGSYLGAGVRLVECSQAVAEECREFVKSRTPEGGKEEAGSAAVTRYFVTDEVSSFNQLASSFMASAPIRADRVEL